MNPRVDSVPHISQIVIFGGWRILSGGAGDTIWKNSVKGNRAGLLVTRWFLAVLVPLAKMADGRLKAFYDVEIFQIMTNLGRHGINIEQQFHTLPIQISRAWPSGRGMRTP